MSRGMKELKNGGIEVDGGKDRRMGGNREGR